MSFPLSVDISDGEVSDFSECNLNKNEKDNTFALPALIFHLLIHSMTQNVKYMYFKYHNKIKVLLQRYCYAKLVHIFLEKVQLLCTVA